MKEMQTLKIIKTIIRIWKEYLKPRNSIYIICINSFLKLWLLNYLKPYNFLLETKIKFKKQAPTWALHNPTRVDMP